MANIMRPFSLVPVFGDLEKEVNRLFFNSGSAIETSDWQPKVDIVEEAKQFIVKVDIPGVDPKNIHIHFDHNNLTIKGEKENEHKETKDSFIRYERSKGSFYRKVMLPDMVDGEKITAKCRNGVLNISIPKSDKGVTKKIEVQE